MEWLFKLKEHLCIKSGLFIVTNEFKHEGFIKDGICGAQDLLCAIPVLEEAHRDREVLILSHIDKVHKGTALHDVAAEVLLVRVQVILFHLLPLAWRNERYTLVLRVTG